MSTLRRTRQLLARLDDANTTGLRRHETIAELEGVLDAPPRWLLPGLAARVAAACGARAPAHRPLSPGESLLLLRDPLSGAGIVTLLRVGSRSTEHPGLSWMARAQATQAMRAVHAIIAHAGRSWPEALDRSLDLAVGGLAADEVVNESSLGLSVALAEASRVLNVPLRGDMAATAEVRGDGTLAPVRFLREKIQALRADAPAVRTVVVARGTEREGLEDSDVAILEVETLLDALRCFELSFDGLDPASIDQAEALAATLEPESKRPHTPNEWSDLADRALAAALTLEQDQQRERSVRCRAWAALFRVHAGAPDDASACLKPGDEAECDPSVRAMVVLSSASAAIDRGSRDALSLAREAVGLARSGSESAVLARALGTFGRASTHSGVAAEGVAALREAIGIFERVDAPQSDQTRCYLATNLRTQGLVDEALSVAREAYARCDRRRGSEHARDTARYLSLELGRSLFERGQLDEARVSLTRVHRPDLGDDSYPNIGALASLARIEIALGTLDGPTFARCLAVATRDRSVIGRVAAQALGWRLLAQGGDPEPSVPWQRAWLDHVPQATTGERAREAVTGFLY